VEHGFWYIPFFLFPRLASDIILFVSFSAYLGSGIKDVMARNPVLDDAQQSFFLAETLVLSLSLCVCGSV
jgi:hypothetical protein